MLIKTLHCKFKKFKSTAGIVFQVLKFIGRSISYMTIVFLLILFAMLLLTLDYILSLFIASLCCLITWLVLSVRTDYTIAGIANEFMIILLAIISLIKEILSVFAKYDESMFENIIPYVYEQGFGASEVIDAFYVVLIVPLLILSLVWTATYIFRSVSKNKEEKQEINNLKRKVDELENKIKMLTDNNNHID